MSRTTGVQDHEAGLRVRLIYRGVKRRLGHVPISTRIRAQDPKLLELAEKMGVHHARPGLVSAKWKELAQLKVAAMVGCPL